MMPRARLLEESPEKRETRQVNWTSKIMRTVPVKMRWRLRRSLLRKVFVAFRHSTVRPTDLIIAGYPRSGTTWLRFLIFDLLSGIDGEFAEVDRYIPMIGRHSRAPALLENGGRGLMTHEPYRADYQRSIYISRDPRNVCISEHKYWTMCGEFDGPLTDFVDVFVTGRSHGFGSWGRHVMSWIEAVEQGRDVFLVTYEALRQSPQRVLRQILDYLEVEVSDDQLVASIQHNDIAAMSRKAAANRDIGTLQKDTGLTFVNEGRAGFVQGTLSAERAARINQVFREAMVARSVSSGPPTEG